MTFTPARAALSGARSELRRDVTAAPVHPHSGHVVEHLRQQVALAGPNLNCLSYGLALYEVGDDVARVDVAWRGHTQPGDALYAGLLGIDPKTRGLPWPVTAYDVLPASVGAFRGVPIPDGALPAAGTDGALAVHRPSTGELWELWQARQDPTTRAWSAAWGGYVPDVRVHDGRYTGGLGVCASGLVGASGVVTLAEARSGVIDHAVGVAVPHVIGGRWSFPASRCDALPATSTAPFAIHEGQRFRLRASVDVDALTLAADWRGNRRPVHPLCRAIARAAQRCGFVVTDQTGTSVAIACEDGNATQLAAAAAGAPVTNPWLPILAGTPTWGVLAGFPWEQLEALPHDYGRA